MPRPAKRDGLSRSARYRAGQQQNGMRLLRMWVEDTRRPGFAEEARRQAELINQANEESEIMAWIECQVDWGDE